MKKLSKILLWVIGIIATPFVLLFIAGVFCAIFEDDTGQNSTLNSVSNTDYTVSSGANYMPAELVQYMGQTPEQCSAALGVPLQDMTQYFVNTFRLNYQDGLCADFTTDNNRKIVKIKLYQSSRKGYTLCGLKDNTSVEASSSILQSAGYINVRENIWRNEEKTDMLWLDEGKWVYEKNETALAEEILRADAESRFTPLYDNNIATVYLGYGQILELYHNSLPRLAYNLDQMTEYQREKLEPVISGRYVLIYGKVTDIYEGGTLSVLCEDEDLTEEEHLVFASTCDAKFKLIPQQQDELIKINNGDTIIAFGRLRPETFNKVLFTKMDLYDGILYSVNGEKVAIPDITLPIDGVWHLYPTGI